MAQYIFQEDDDFVFFFENLRIVVSMFFFIGNRELLQKLFRWLKKKINFRKCSSKNGRKLRMIQTCFTTFHQIKEESRKQSTLYSFSPNAFTGIRKKKFRETKTKKKTEIFSKPKCNLVFSSSMHKGFVIC